MSSSNDKTISSSFSSPEIVDSATAADTSISSSGGQTSSSIATNNATNSTITSTTSSGTIKMFATTGIKVDTTRDSGFSDSLADESSSSLSTSANKNKQKGGRVPQSQSASGIYSARTEHVLSVPEENNNNTTANANSNGKKKKKGNNNNNNTNGNNNSGIQVTTKTVTNSKGQLRSVQEDINITQAKQQSSEITNNEEDEIGDEAAAAIATSCTTSPVDDQGKEYITIVKTTKVTTKVKHVKASKTTNNKNKNKNKQQQQQQLEANENDDDVRTVTNTSVVTHAKTAVIRSGPELDGDQEIIQEHQQQQEQESSAETDDEIAKPDTLFKVNINKTTEELVFENHSPKLANINQSDSSQPPQTTDSNVVDLNSTVLDCEEILSDYSTHIAAPTTTGDISIPRLINETQTALTEVTSSLLNQPQQSDDIVHLPTPPQTVQQTIKIESVTIIKRNADEKPEEVAPKKKKRFSLFSSCKSSSSDEPKKPKKEKLPKKDKKKQKATTENAAAKVDVTEPLSVNVKQQQQQHEPIAKTSSNSPSSHGIKYVLIDDEQKDRILYLKPDCVELIIRRFIEHEQAPLNALDDANKQSLSKIVSRALDLLRHDRVESFEKLSARLKEEYQIVDEDNKEGTIINASLADQLFGNLLKQSLVDEKILLRLELDKTNRRPYQELIDFGPSVTQSIWNEKFSSPPQQESSTITNQQQQQQKEQPAESITTNLDNTVKPKLTDEINELQSNLNQIVNKLVEEKPQETAPTVAETKQEVEEEKKDEESVAAVLQQEELPRVEEKIVEEEKKRRREC